MKNITWEDIWGGVAICLVVIFVAGILTVSFAPQEITYYYASGGDGGNGCVYSHWVWHVDERVFCPQNKAELPDYVAKFNGTLKK